MPSNETEVAPGLKTLTRRRGTIKARITRYITTYLTNSEIDIGSESEEVVSSVLEKIKLAEFEFEEVQREIETLLIESDIDLDEISNAEADERMRIEANIRKLQVPFLQRLKVVRSEPLDQTSITTPPFMPAPTATSSVPSNRMASRLPEIKLPEFTGNINEWLAFCQLFRSLIDDDDRLTDAQRLIYLKTNVKGEAYNAIATLPPTDDNYTVAWNLLKGRYENKRVLLKTHLHNLLFKLPAHTTESAAGLRHLLDVVTTNLTALSSLGLPTNHWDEILVHLVQVKVDKQTQRDWEESIRSNELVSFNRFKEFLQQKCATLEVLSSSNRPLQPAVASHPYVPHSRPFNRFNANRAPPNQQRVHNAAIIPSCHMCRGTHRLFSCRRFLDLRISDRKSFLDSQQRCHNCFWQNHNASECTYGACKICQGPHNTLLHEDRPKPSTSSDHHSANTCQSSSSSRPFESMENFLPTAMVQVYDAKGTVHVCRVLFDSGSQCNFIRDDLMQKLQLPTQGTHIRISTIGNQPSECTSIGTVKISSRLTSFGLSLSCLVVNQVTSNLPLRSVNRHNWNLPDVELADPQFARSQQIDILIGVSDFWNSLLPEAIKATIHHPHLQNTHFGWIIGGRTNEAVPVNTAHYLSNVAVTHELTHSPHELHEAVARLFSLEVDNETKRSPTDEACELNFEANYRHCANSKRFTVRLPFKSENPVLGDSYKAALRRFHALESRLKRSPELQIQYNNFMSEYLNLNHMSLGSSSLAKYYLPHHCVVRNDKSTTKLRVVFDASAKSSNGLSLNDLLYTGPTIQNELFSILLRFRTYQFVLCADVEKMYRQVNLETHDRPYQAILWRDADGKLQTYFLNTVTYGITCAPYLAIKSLQKTTEVTAIKSEHAYQAILNDFYVDDLLTGAESINEIQTLKTDINNILLEGGFPLRKWSSNHYDICDKETSISLDKENVSKLLGVQWNSSQDTVSYSLTQSCHTPFIATKRTVLSLASSLFDPLGLVSPVVIVAKLILRTLWTCRIDWDDPIPQDVKERWTKYITELAEISTIHISRKVICAQANRLEIHGFCDASQEAYGAAVYIKSIDVEGNVQISLLCSKSRVAPIRIITIPRLELCAAVLLTNLVSKVKSSLRQSVSQIYYWTDSSIVLSWLNAATKHKQIFVANRVSEIHSLSATNSWRHVRTDSNPADLITRGCSPSDLAGNSLWWHGPSWLSLNETDWPRTDLPQVAVHAQISQEEWDVLKRFSNLNTLIHVLSYCLRFIKHCKGYSVPPTLRLSQEEIETGHINLLTCVQREGFSRKVLNNFHKCDLFASLHPFRDDNGLLRVGGRLSNNIEFTYDKRYPIILPRNHAVTKLIIRQEHEKLFHAGPLHTLASLRETYWPISAKSQIRQIIHSCIPCRKAHPRVLSQLMGNLPRERITPAKPFTRSGIDYAGPIQLKEGKGRGKRTIKAYMALFVCFATKAVHLELVSDCTTAAFLAAFRRFISRRGMVTDLYSDNGTNFKGANAELKQLYDLYRSDSFMNTANSNLSHIRWHFIPPNSPHWGGLWEAGIKTVKSHVKRVIGDQSLTFEEYGTLLAQIEACVNSRPLYELSSNPQDLLPLTPAHFLIGSSLTAIPEPTYLDVPSNRLTRWQLLQRMTQHFWDRWSVEYIHHLQQRPKWQRLRTNITPNTLVLLREQNLPPYVWILGRVLDCYKGQDNVVRTVLVRTAKGTYKRTINRISMLLEAPA